MILWAILTVMVTAAALMLAAPLMRRDEQGHVTDTVTGAPVYRDQLAEVERELREGAIDETQAEAARLEIKRRVVALQRDGDTPIRRLAQVERKFFAAIVAGVIAIGGTILYAVNGSPELPAAPRTASQPLSPNVANAPPHPTPAASAAGAAATAPALSSVDDMIDRLVQRMAGAPNDADGWRMLGWSYFRTDRFQEAAAAYAKASALQPAVGPLKTAWAEALVRAADGKVSAEALRLCEEALKLDAKDARARYFVGLAREQAGDAKAALDAWIALLGDATAADDWEPEVRQQVIDLAKASGIDIAARLPPSPSGPGILGRLNRGSEQPAPSAGGPSAADVKAAESLTPAERDAMIRVMVDGLQAKLDANPRDAEGWIKLLRSRLVLGEHDQAKSALARALKTFADAPAERDRIAAAAREGGLSP